MSTEGHGLTEREREALLIGSHTVEPVADTGNALFAVVEQIVAQHRAEAAAEALFAAADQVPDKTVRWAVYDMTRVPARVDYIAPTNWLRRRGERLLTSVIASAEDA